MTQILYTIPQAAEQVGCSARQIQRAINATDAAKASLPLLPSKRLGVKGKRIAHADLIVWADNLPDA